MAGRFAYPRRPARGYLATREQGETRSTATPGRIGRCILSESGFGNQKVRGRPMKRTFHGGQFFHSIGLDFSQLGRSEQVINADVLDAWFDPSPRVLAAIREYLPFVLRTSPPIYSEGLTETISKVRGIARESILPGGGSSDLIFSLFPRIIGRGERALILDPMYGEYQHILENVLGAAVTRFELTKAQNFSVDPDLLILMIRRVKPKVVVLVNPNSPTGNHLPKAEVLRVIRSVSPATQFVVDETYVEYVGREESLETEATEVRNLVVIKSMSKVYALSGARVGYMVASEAIVNQLSVALRPWAVSLCGQIAAVEALKDSEYYEERYADTHLLRRELTEMLSSQPDTKVYPSVANFVLVELLGEGVTAERVVRTLIDEDIYIRNVDSMSTGFGNRFVRIAVKDGKKNRRVVEAFLRAAAPYAKA